MRLMLMLQSVESGKLRQRVGQVEFSQLVSVRFPSLSDSGTSYAGRPGAGVAPWATPCSNAPRPNKAKPRVLKLMRQRDFVARLRSTQ